MALTLDVTAQMPTREEIQRFVTNFDGEARPDLVPFWLKVGMVASSFEFDETLIAGLTKEDLALVQEYVTSRSKEDEQDRQALLDMVRKLCRKIDALGGEALGVESAKIDQTILDRKNSRAHALVERLSPEGSSVFLARTDSVAAHVQGSLGDFIGLSKAHPDYQKEQLRETCRRLGMLPDGGVSD